MNDQRVGDRDPGGAARDPKVSVVIPAYNTARFLPEAIESVLGQTFTSYEVIVIDDGSTDATVSIARSFGERVRCLRQENQGPSAARNHGIAAARGEFVAFLDSDDRWEPEMLAEQLAAFAADPEAGLVFTNCINTDGEVLLPVDCSAQRTAHSGRVFHHLLRENFVITSTVMVRRACLAATGGFDPALRVSEDFDLWVRIARLFPLRFVPRSLARYRIHDGGAFSDLDQRLRARRYIFEKLAAISGPPLPISPSEFRLAQARADCHIANILLRLNQRRRAREIYWRTLRRGIDRPRVLFLLTASWLPAPAWAMARWLRRLRGRPRQCLEVLRAAPSGIGSSAPAPTVDRSGVEPAEPLPGSSAAGMARFPSVVFVSHHYPPAFSGAGIQAERLAAALQRRGCAITVLTEGTEGRRHRERTEHQGLTIIRVPSWSAFELGPLRDRSWSLAVAPTLARIRADVFHFHGLAGSEVLLAIALARGIPAIVKRSMAGPEPRIKGRSRGRWESIRRLLALRADRIVAISSSIHTECVAAGIPEERILRWPNGVDLQRFRPLAMAERRQLRQQLGLPEAGVLLVTLGGVHERKRQKIQVRALARLKGISAQITLLCAGPNRTEYASELLQEAAELGIRDRVLLRHFIDPDHARLALQSADIYTLTSSREGQPNSLLEALACGLPSVAVQLPGITDEIITQGVDGVLLDEPDDTMLARIWRDLISSENERRRLGEAARRTVVQRYDLEMLADRYVDLYRSLERAPRRGRRS